MQDLASVIIPKAGDHDFPQRFDCDNPDSHARRNIYIYIYMDRMLEGETLLAKIEICLQMFTKVYDVVVLYSVMSVLLSLHDASVI